MCEFSQHISLPTRILCTMAMHSNYQAKCVAACTLLTVVLHTLGLVLQPVHRCFALRSRAVRKTWPADWSLCCCSKTSRVGGTWWTLCTRAPTALPAPTTPSCLPRTTSLRCASASAPPRLLSSALSCKPVSGQSIMHILQHTGQLGLVLRMCSATSVLQGAEDSLPSIQHAKARVPACRLAAT